MQMNYNFSIDFPILHLHVPDFDPKDKQRYQWALLKLNPFNKLTILYELWLDMIEFIEQPADLITIEVWRMITWIRDYEMLVWPPAIFLSPV